MDPPRRGTAISRLRREGRSAEALSLLDEHLPAFPEEFIQLGLMKARLHGELNQPAAALEALRAIAQGGGWLSAHALASVRQLAAARELPGYADLIALFTERYAAALAVSDRQELLVERPASAPAALLLTLHSGYNGPATWAPAVTAGCCLGLVQSTAMSAPGIYVWESWEQAEAKTQTAFESLATGCPLVLGGFSEGAGIAAWLTLLGSVPALGFVLIAPWLPDMSRVEAALAEAAGRDVRGYIVVGEQDHCLPYAGHLAELMRQRDLAVALEVVPSLPYQPPADIGERLARGLQFVLGE